MKAPAVELVSLTCAALGEGAVRSVAVERLWRRDRRCPRTLVDGRRRRGEFVRLTPAGKVNVHIDLPVSRPSKPAFGGADLGTLFLISIRVVGES